jgi:hypothetical protein
MRQLHFRQPLSAHEGTILGSTQLKRQNEGRNKRCTPTGYEQGVQQLTAHERQHTHLRQRPDLRQGVREVLLHGWVLEVKQVVEPLLE